jgi:hypothetical protein
MSRHPTNPHSLTALPQEITNNVISLINDKPTLSSLTRTCTHFRNTCQHTLYTTFHSSDDPASRIVSFIRTLQSRPDLASQLKHISLHWPPHTETLLTSSPEITFFNSIISNLGLRFPYGGESWHQDPEQQLIPFELLLAYTPNIETLDWSISDGKNMELIPQFGNLPRPIEFRQLRCLEIPYQFIAGDRHALSSDQWLPFLQLAPNLESFSPPNDDGFYIPDADIFPIMSKLTTLDFSECQSNEKMITSLITHCPVLKVLKLQWTGANGYDDETVEDWNVMNVWDALSTVRNALEHVEFYHIDEIPLEPITHTTISSLSSFTNLKILKTNASSLGALHTAFQLHANAPRSISSFMATLFPSSLQHITIYDPSPTLIPFLLALASAQSHCHYPNLRTVEIAPSPTWEPHHAPPDWMLDEKWAEHEGEVKAAFENAGGIEFVIVVSKYVSEWIPGPDSFRKFRMAWKARVGAMGMNESQCAQQ